MRENPGCAERVLRRCSAYLSIYQPLTFQFGDEVVFKPPAAAVNGLLRQR